MKGFTVNQTQTLMVECLDALERGSSLQSVFTRNAIKTKRSRGTVRNHYYQTLKDIERGAFKGELPQGVEKLKAKRPVAFTNDDAEKLFESIQSAKSQGKSVRQAILDMSNGDGKLALRYQNKYRSMLKRQQKSNFEKINLQSEDFKYFNKLSTEIDALVERIKDKYAKECVKLKEENLRLEKQIKKLQKSNAQSQVASFFADEKESTNNQ